MTKNDITCRIAEEMEIAQGEVRRVVQLAFDEITNGIANVGVCPHFIRRDVQNQASCLLALEKNENHSIYGGRGGVSDIIRSYCGSSRVVTRCLQRLHSRRRRMNPSFGSV